MYCTIYMYIHVHVLYTYMCIDVIPPLPVAGNDYTSLTMNLTFNAITTSHDVTVMTTPDNVVEEYEVFTLSLTSAGVEFGLIDPTATVTIEDQSSTYMYMFLNER